MNANPGPTTTTTRVPLFQRFQLNYINTGYGLAHLLAVISGVFCMALLGKAYDQGTYYQAKCDSAQEKRYNSFNEQEKEDLGSCEALVPDSYEHCRVFGRPSYQYREDNGLDGCPIKWLLVVPFYIIVVVWFASFISLITLTMWEGAPKHLGLIVNIICGAFMVISVLALIVFSQQVLEYGRRYPRCVDENNGYDNGDCRSNQTYRYWLVVYGMLTALLTTVFIITAAKLRRDQVRFADQAARNAAAVGQPVQYPSNRTVIAAPVSVQSQPPPPPPPPPQPQEPIES